MLSRFLRLHKQVERERTSYKFVRKSLTSKKHDFPRYRDETEFGKNDLVTLKGVDICIGKQVSQVAKDWQTKKQHETEIISMLGILIDGKTVKPSALQKLQRLIYEKRNVVIG